MKPTEVFRKEFKFHAEDGIESYNTYLKECKKQGFKPSKDRTELVKKYAFVDEQTKEEAILSPIKVDQHVNEATYNEEFNHIDNIHEAWEQAGYETVKGRVSLKLKKEKSNNGKSKRLGFQETILNIHELHKHKDEFIFTYGDTLTKAKKEHPEEFDIYTKLGMEKIEELEFNRKAISKEQIRIKELDAETKLLMLLAIEFTVGECYTKGFIKMKLQECYNIVGITSRKATAEQLGEKGRFEIKECKIWKNGKLVSGFRIIRQQFNLKMVV